MMSFSCCKDTERCCVSFGTVHKKLLKLLAIVVLTNMYIESVHFVFNLMSLNYVESLVKLYS